MEATESFLPVLPGAATSCTKNEPPAYYDYSEHDFHAYKPGKSNAYAEPNNNNNNQHSKHGHEGGNFSIENSIFWSEKEPVKMEPELLDDLNSWGEWGDHKVEANTDGTVYTLTVLNSNEWYKNGAAEGLGEKATKKPDNIDIDSFLNIIPETDTSDSSNYYYPEFPSGPEFSETKVNEMVNNNDWKTNNMNDSLLRSALQGKRNSYKKSYGEAEGVAPPQQPPQVLLASPYNGEEPPSNIDDILGLTSIESFDDYEKIKKIANEVADCAKYSLNEIPPMNNFVLPVENVLLDTRVTNNNGKCGKKYSKKGLGGGGGGSAPVKSGSGTRKERSLHYCSICSKGFKDKYSVNVHVRTHTGEKPFTCTLCGKSFRQKAHLAKHYQTHLAQSQKHLGNGSTNHSKSRSSSKVIENNR